MMERFSGPQRRVVAVLFVLFGYGDVLVAVMEPRAEWGGFFYKHCGLFTFESCFHSCACMYVL